jgi:formate-dependent nitrite reductase membrane component NrfD
MAEHFAQAPHWEWWIVFYFFTAGIAGGCYGLATMLQMWGTERDAAIARRGFLLAFPLSVLCGIFLTVDLGQPMRFYHMLINMTPGAMGLNWKPWSPIQIGSWALLVFSAFALVSFLVAWQSSRSGKVAEKPSAGMLVFNIIGSVFALFLASYTGVVLSVSNQPVWSDSYAIGGLFIASGLSASAALMQWFAINDENNSSETRLATADGYFVVLEIVMLAAFFTTLANAGTIGKTLGMPWLVLWILVIASFIPPLLGMATRRTVLASSAGPITTTTVVGSPAMSAWIVIVGVFLLRLVVIFSAQF